MKSSLSFLCVLVIVGRASANKYCNRDCYIKENKHIGCSHNGKFKPECLNAKMVHLDSSKIQFLVDGHNKRRNMAAGGGHNFPPACQMATMQWDDELAYLASLHVQDCMPYHDKCHDTDKFPVSGQNVALNYSSEASPFYDLEFFETTLNAWFNEGGNFNPQWLTSYPAVTRDPIGHFSLMVTEDNDYLGCAASTFDKANGFSYIMLTCNYAKENIAGIRIYNTCKWAGERCKTTKNPRFQNLCS